MRKQNDPKQSKTRQKKNKPQQDKGIRQPRPLGLTLLAQQTRNQPTTIEHIHKILNYILSYNMEVNGKKLTIATLATYLNIPKHTVLKAFTEYQAKMSNVVVGLGNNIRGALIFQALEKNLEDQALVSQQLQLLQASQGNSYKAYISSSVNEILGLKLKSSAAILDILKAVSGPGMGTGNTLIQNNFGTQNEVPATKSLGINEALGLLQKNGLLPMAYQATDFTDLRQKNNLESVPEVRATHQAQVATDGMSLLTPPTSNNKHIDRRANEEDADIEELG